MNRPTCPTPGKKAYSTKKQADDAARFSTRVSLVQMKKYKCHCGMYHIAHKRPAEGGKRR